MSQLVPEPSSAIGEPVEIRGYNGQTTAPAPAVASVEVELRIVAERFADGGRCPALPL